MSGKAVRQVGSALETALLAVWRADIAIVAAAEHEAARCVAAERLIGEREQSDRVAIAAENADRERVRRLDRAKRLRDEVLRETGARR